ncbi:hypothetical protein FACS189452_05290 [Bacteroidia bacterium]|nr:hypothetical protein FACS189452_05290 [Bacteroidia bacterium]GHT81035.1 hypothetical protein FACS189467_4410 [Bacteroidia bacterium]
MHNQTNITHQIAGDEDTLLFAIVSGEIPARMAWLLNQALRIDLEDQREIEIKYSDDVTIEFPVFVANAEFEEGVYTLFTNHSEGHYLLDNRLNKFRNVDYFLQFSCILYDNEKEELCREISGIPTVTFCYPTVLQEPKLKL